MTTAPIRDLWLKLHRWFGLFSAVFLGLAALTGCILCFVRPLDQAFNADLFNAPLVASPMPVTQAVDRFQAAHLELHVQSFPLNLPPGKTIPVKVRAAKGKLPFDQVFLARDDGHLIGARSTEAAWNRRGATEMLLDLHFTLIGGNFGKYLMGAIAVGWMISNIIGGYLTFPTRAPFWKSWGRTWRFSFKSRLPKFMLDTHQASGLWLFIPLAVLAFTSAGLNFFFPVWEPMVSHLVPPQPSPFVGKVPYPKGVPGHLTFTRTLELAETLRAQTGERWQVAIVSYQPTRNLYGVSLTDTGRPNYKGLGPVSWFFADRTGRFVHADSPYADPSVGLIRMLYPLHSGRAGGLLGVGLVFLLGVVTFWACVSGVYVWWKKRGPRAAAQRAAKAAGAG